MNLNICSIYDFTDYTAYLKKKLQTRGAKSAASKAIGCQTSFISQILSRKNHLSLEQASELNFFLNHTEDESQFFILLILYNKASNSKLKKHFKGQIELFLKKRLLLSERLEIKDKLPEEIHSIYYSHWYYAAVHVLVSIPAYQDKHLLAQYLKLEMEQLNHILELLVRAKLIEFQRGKYVIGKKAIHLGHESTEIAKHHTNWRLRAIQSLDKKSEKDLHYSSVVTLSKKDAIFIRELLVKNIQKVKSVIKSSKEEVCHAFSLDFFALK